MTHLPTKRSTTSPTGGSRRIEAAALAGFASAAALLAPPVTLGQSTTDPPPKARVVQLPSEDNPTGEEARSQGVLPGSEDDLFTYANLLFSQEQYDLAILQYGAYLDSFPKGKFAEEAYYRLGESHLNKNEASLAEQAYRNLLTKFPTGQFAGFAAYRIGTLAFTREKYAIAISYFKIAERDAKKEDIKLSALYYRGRSLQLSGAEKSAISVFEQSSSKKEKNPFWQRSVLALGRIKAAAGDKPGALSHYEALASEQKGVSSAVEAEALVQAGLIHSDLKNTEKANGFFERALSSAAPAEWKALARFGLIDAYYAAKRYKDVVSTYLRTTDFALADDTRPKMLLMVGNSYRFLGQFTKAIDIYLIIQQYYGNLREGQEAAYNKVICYYNLDDPSLARFVDSFVRNATSEAKNLGLTDRALLMKAESFFRIGVFDRAAEAYAALRIDKLPEELQETSLYRRGFSQADSSDSTAALNSLTKFLEDYPESPLAPNARAKRALSYKALGDATKAIADFDEIVENEPGGPAAELAYQQSALLKGQRRDTDGMVATFSALLEHFPESSAAPEATFWIGWGHFENKAYKESIPYLEKARVMDPEEYFDRASLKVVLANFYLRDLAALVTAIDTFWRKNPQARIPPQILGWVGLKQFEAGDFTNAEKFLILASTPKDPKATRGEVWNYLGKTRLEQDKFEKAIEPFSHYIATLERRPAEKARALLDQSYAFLGAKRYDDAAASAEEGLSLQKDGRVNAQLWIARGDVEMARENYEKAVENFIVPSQTFDDPKITPEAIDKSATALEKLGRKKEASDLRKELKKRYPSFKGKTS